MAEYDTMLGAYRDWINEWIFGKKGETDEVLWLGDGRWLVFNVEGPDAFLVEISRAEIVRRL